MTPIRGTPRELDGSFVIQPPADATGRQRVAAIEMRFAVRRAAHPLADAHVAEHLLLEAATKRFAARVDGDLAIALRELARIREELRIASMRADGARERSVDDPACGDMLLTEDMAGKAFQTAFDYVLAMPLRRIEDLSLKARFATIYCVEESERHQALRDIAAFTTPDRADPPSKPHLIAA